MRRWPSAGPLARVTDGVEAVEGAVAEVAGAAAEEATARLEAAVADLRTQQVDLAEIRAQLDGPRQLDRTRGPAAEDPKAHDPEPGPEPA